MPGGSVMTAKGQEVSPFSPTGDTGTGTGEGPPAMTPKKGSWFAGLSKRLRWGLIVAVILVTAVVIGIVVWQVVTQVKAGQANGTPAGQKQSQVQSTSTLPYQDTAAPTATGNTALTPPVGKGAWLGWAQTKYLIVFGASYTTVGYDYTKDHPNLSNIIGNPAFPGRTTCGGAPNFVGYMSSQLNQSKMLVYDYAIAGAIVQGVEQQVKEAFLPNAGIHPPWAPWKSNDSIFLTFVGINDVSANLNIPVQMSLYFTLQASLYNTGARNFVFYQVPPFNRSPTGIKNKVPASRIASWNNQLLSHAETFQRTYPNTTILVYNSSPIFTDVLDHPTNYGFKDNSSVCNTSKCIWWDGLHPTTWMHKIMAKDLVDGIVSKM